MHVSVLLINKRNVEIDLIAAETNETGNNSSRRQTQMLRQDQLMR